MLIEGDNTDSIMETVRFYQDFGLKRSLTAAEDCQNTALGKKKIQNVCFRIRGLRKDGIVSLLGVCGRTHL